MSAKIELQVQRQKLIEQLKSETDPRRIASVQADLTIVNAEIKKLNITEAAENQRNATVKRSIGMAQHEADTARANERITEGTAPDGEPFGFQAKLEEARTVASVEAKKPMTLGEFLLKNAKQMLRSIEKMKHKEPHTAAFEPQLRAFIEAQKAHCRRHNEKALTKVESENPIDWEKTWAEG